MTESPYSVADRCHEVLKLDFSADEFARVAADNNYSVETISAMSNLFDYLCSKKEQATIQMLLQTSRLPTKNAKTFENFDFSVLKGKEIDRLKSLPSLAAVYGHKNLAATRILLSLARQARARPISLWLSAMNAASTG